MRSYILVQRNDFIQGLRHGGCGKNHELHGRRIAAVFGHIAGIGAASAGGQGQHYAQYQKQRAQVFHIENLPFFKDICGNGPDAGSCR